MNQFYHDIMKHKKNMSGDVQKITFLYHPTPMKYYL